MFIPSSNCNGFQPLNLFVCNNHFMTITCSLQDVSLKFRNVLTVLCEGENYLETVKQMSNHLGS
jgi:hypothetical protein